MPQPQTFVLVYNNFIEILQLCHILYTKGPHYFSLLIRTNHTSVGKATILGPEI